MASDEANPWRSARLLYRAPEPEDEDFFFELQSDPEGYLNSETGLKKPPSKRDTKAYREHVSEKDLLGVVICIASSADPSEVGKRVGVVALSGNPPGVAIHRHTEIGLVLLPAYRGKGYGSEAIQWVTAWAFEYGGIHKVMVKAFEYNEGARRLYEKLGFKQEGIVRELWWHKGRFWDDYQYSMLEQEWRERQASKS